MKQKPAAVVLGVAAVTSHMCAMDDNNVGTRRASEVRNTSSRADASSCDDHNMFAVTNPDSKLGRLPFHIICIIRQLRHATASFVLIRRQARRIVDGHDPRAQMITCSNKWVISTTDAVYCGTFPWLGALIRPHVKWKIWNRRLMGMNEVRHSTAYR